MPPFQAYSNSVEVNGQTVLSIVKGMGAFKDSGLATLARHGIKSPSSAGWYSQRQWLAAFEEIAKSIGPRTLFQIGQSIPESAKFPPGINSVEKALGSIDMAYHLNHRGGEIGHYTFKSTGPKSGVMECRNPYPCDFDRGIIEALVRRFAPPPAAPKVAHDSSKPCRSKQGDCCVFLISW
jgi:hypothetical protein